MANKKISEFSNLTSMADNDEFVVVDKSEGVTKRIVYSLIKAPIVGADGSFTLSDPQAVVLDEAPVRAALGTQHTNATGTSKYRFVQDSYDILILQREGDTTGDGAYWTILNVMSPTAAETADSEATLSLTSYNGAPGNKSRTLDVYNDDYSRDHGMGLRQLTRNMPFNPIRFENHDRTTSGGAFLLNEAYAYLGNYYIDYVSNDVTGITPTVDDWIWDNAGLYLPDDTKIIRIEVDVPVANSTRLHLNKAVLLEGEIISLRGKAIKEIARMTPERQTLFRKFIADLATTSAEFGNDIQVDKSIFHKAIPTYDLEVSGESTILTAGENLVFGEVCYIKSDGTMGRADASAVATTPVFAFSTATTLNEAIGRFLLRGFVRNDAWSWTVGGALYLSETTGEITQTAPVGSPKAVQILGVATHADRIYFNPSLSVTVL